ncbi:MAG: hypothetical protein LBE09_07850 [Christensenellaceae bacterium]|jgi:hypothetical protein|nr:hypothetical protein [Christensenellaceae bacterium]
MRIHKIFARMILRRQQYERLKILEDSCSNLVSKRNIKDIKTETEMITSKKHALAKLKHEKLKSAITTTALQK